MGLITDKTKGVIMSKRIKFCKKCYELEKDSFNDGNYPKKYGADFPGFYSWLKDPEDNKCYFCKSDLEESPFKNDELRIIREISYDLSFLEAMIKLKESDPIEFQLKISQFKTQLQQQESTNQTENIPKCPTCGSTKLSKVPTASKAGSVFLFGLLSQKIKKTWHCDNCKYEW